MHLQTGTALASNIEELLSFLFVNGCVQNKKLGALFARGLHEETQSSAFLWNMICKMSLLHNSIASI